MRTFTCDLETFSSAELKKTGAVKYTEADDFELLLMSYAFDDDPVAVWDFTQEGTPDWLSRVLTDPDITKVAWNMAFERSCFKAALGVYSPPEQWRDAMTLSAMNGLPLTLEGAGEALQLQEQKLKEGKTLISYFCKPCKPTIANGGRTRNLPEHAPEKWEKFRAYCQRDTETERAIYNRLLIFPVPEYERRLEALDARMNERGVRVDMELVKSAVYVDKTLKQQHLDEMRRLTGLENPNSVAQLKEWLAAVGVPVDSLNKAAVSDLKSDTSDRTVRRVLELRQLLGKTSVKKYDAMQAAACKDGRIRGLLQYYGAARTGRWAGRRVQLQNLAQNHIDDIDKVRELVRARDLETLELCFDSVPDVLSQLIRTGLIAEPGHTFLVADYSAIEARVIAYLAGEKWRQDVFAQGGDIYCSSASQMFKVPVVKHGVNGHLRQKGKVAELACIAEGQLVLTNHGEKPIETVTASDLVWDGVEWVKHDGVVCRGTKEVLSYGGLEATADHIVWAEIGGTPRTLPFGDAAACGARLLQTGAGGHPLRVGDDNLTGETVEQIVEPLLCADPVQWVRGGAMDRPGQPSGRQVQGVSELLATSGGSSMAGQTLHTGATEMHEPQRPRVQKLRREGHRVPLPVGDRGLPLHDRDARSTGQRDGDRPHRRGRALRTGEPPVGDTSAKLPKPTPVYDILNAGPRHRFTVSGVLVHNCGYGGGVNALKAFGADKMGLTDDEMQEIVTSWRAASPTIPRLWRRVEDAARAALETPGRRCAVMRKYRDPVRSAQNEALTGCTGYSQDFLAGGAVATYWRDKDALRCKLPSGRILAYWGARIEGSGIVFMGQNQTTRKWEKTSTWGGKLVENIVQAFARDCLAVAMLRLDEAGYDLVFSVHDELIAEAPDGSRWEDMAEIMGRPIDWAPGLLLRADGYDTKFYMKD